MQSDFVLDEKDAKIAHLSARVKSLELELAERVRGFLLQSRNKSYRPTRDQCAQTVTSLSQPNSPVRLCPPIDATERRAVLDLSYSPQQSDPQSQLSTPAKQSNNVPKLRTSTEENLVLQIQQLRKSQVDYLKEARKARKQIRAMKEQIRFLGDLAEMAREGLFAAEEQNYQLRLELQEMQKKPDSATKEKDQQERVEIMCSELKLCRQQLKTIAETFLGQEKEESVQAVLKHWQDLTKQIFQISSKVPLEGESVTSVFFQPETISEAGVALKVLEEYGNSVQRREEMWEKQVKTIRDGCHWAMQQIASLLDRSTREEVLSLLNEGRDEEKRLFIHLFSPLQG